MKLPYFTVSNRRPGPPSKTKAAARSSGAAKNSTMMLTPASSTVLEAVPLELPAMTPEPTTESQGRHRAAMLLIVTDGGLLLHHRDDKPGIPHPDRWAGFGGAVEDGETVEEALRREVLEETGLEITEPVFLTDTVDHEGDGRLVSLFYVTGHYTAGDIDLREGAGVAVQRFEDLPALTMTPFVRRAVESLLLPEIRGNSAG